ncbi:MAG TPA: hypothetical protein VFK88_08145 [Gallionella sp.]|nr:hypothetical protein [Gallionella sp.]
MFKIDGLEELQNKLRDLAEKAEEFDGQHSVPVSELLTESFMSQHTSFSSADEMFKASGFKTETQEEFAAIPVNDWDSYIRSISSFDGWQSMLGAAGQEWAKRKLGL